jgi:hypothetical protein
VAAALLAFFLGGFGVHKFYLGQTAWGVVYLVFFWTFIPRIVSFVEFIVLLATSEEDFQRKYPGPGPGPLFVVAMASLAFLLTVAMLGAIAIPNFMRYQLRSKASGTVSELIALMNAEVKRANSGAGLLAFAPLPAAPPGTGKRTLDAEEQAVADQLGWAVPSTYAQFRVALAGEGVQRAAAFCVETDLDGDGQTAAVVGFLPIVDASGKVAVAPPAAPCSAAAVIAEVGTAFRAEWANKVVSVSPPDVF